MIDNSISTKLGGLKQEITLVFTDVRGFTTIAETADPDVLLLQTSRYFAVLTEAFLAEGGTVDKFIGDAVMVFWNAPNLQPDHVDLACRSVLAAKAAGLEFGVKVLIGSLGREHRPAGAGNVVGLRIGGIPEHHHGVADELVDRSAFGEKRLRQHGKIT